MNKVSKFVPITKIDKSQRMVYGWASTDDLDSDGEVITVKALEKALPEYMRFPTIREMHQPKAVGKTVTASIKDGKGLYIEAKIVRDDVWKLIKEGVYKAFSVGGNVVQKIGNKIEEMDLVEISLVDVPANKAAIIELWKRDSKNTKLIEALIKLHLYEHEEGGEIAMKKTKNVKDEEVEIEEPVSTDEVVEAETSEPEDQEVDDATGKEDSKATDEEATNDTDEESDESSDKSEDVTMTKFDKAQETLEKMNKEESGDSVEKLNFEKTINKVVSTLATAIEVIAKLDNRVRELEKAPQTPKSKAAFVYKNNAEKGDQNDTEADKSSDKVSQINKRLSELNELKEKMGPNAFAKAGYSNEAGRLYTELERLERGK